MSLLNLSFISLIIIIIPYLTITVPKKCSNIGFYTAKSERFTTYLNYTVYDTFHWQEHVKYSMGDVEIYVFQLLMDVGVNAISVYNYKITSHVIAVCCVIYCFDFLNI